MNVTHAAIAQHVRTVEDFVGTTLLVRSGRGMALTDAGRRLLGPLTDSFSTIIDAVRDVSATMADAPLSITVTPTFAENWLMPRMSAFWSAHPDITVAITPTMALSDLRRDGFDFAIRYGRGAWKGHDATFLASASFVVVAAPSLVSTRQVETLSELLDLPWLFETMHRETRLWARDNGLDPASCHARELATLSMVISATRAGAGVSIQSRALVETDIAAGTLVPLIEVPQEDLGYYIVTRPGHGSAKQSAFIKWLLSVA